MSGIEQFKSLRVLEVKFNLIKDINEISKINNPHFLTHLNLLGNPVEKDYRFNFEFFNRTFNKFFFFRPFFLTLNSKSLQFLNGANKSKFKPVENYYKTSRNSKSPKENANFLTTFRCNTNEAKAEVEFLFQEAKNKLSSKFPKKELPQIIQCEGIPLQTTATFAKQQIKKRENNSFFLFNTANTNSSFHNENEKKEMSKIFRNRSPIAKNSYYEEISFDMSLNNLEHEGGLNQNISLIAQSHLNKHIENIDDDIEGLTNIFYSKFLKEKTMRALKNNIITEKEKIQVLKIIFLKKITTIFI